MVRKHSLPYIVFAIFVLLAHGDVATGQGADPYEGRINALLKQMTLEEKIGQMNQYNGFWDFTGPIPDNDDIQQKMNHLKSGLVGSMLNIRGVENVRKIQK